MWYGVRNWQSTGAVAHLTHLSSVSGMPLIRPFELKWYRNSNVAGSSDRG